MTRQPTQPRNNGTPASAVGAGAVLVGLLLLTAAPRIAVSAARIPIPPVPAPGEDVGDGDLEEIDHDLRGRIADGRRPHGQLPTPEVLRHRFLTSRSWLTGLVAAAGAVCTSGALIALTGDGSGPWSALGAYRSSRRAGASSRRDGRSERS